MRLHCEADFHVRLDAWDLALAAKVRDKNDEPDEDEGRNHCNDHRDHPG